MYCAVLPLLAPLLRLVAAAALGLAPRRLGLGQVLDALLEQLEVVGRVRRGRALCRGRVRVGRVVLQVLCVVCLGTRGWDTSYFARRERVEPAWELVERRILPCGRGEFVRLDNPLLAFTLRKEVSS